MILTNILLWILCGSVTTIIMVIDDSLKTNYYSSRKGSYWLISRNDRVGRVIGNLLTGPVSLLLVVAIFTIDDHYE